MYIFFSFTLSRKLKAVFSFSRFTQNQRFWDRAGIDFCIFLCSADYFFTLPVCRGRIFLPA
jgi:hypothetical protein